MNTEVIKTQLQQLNLRTAASELEEVLSSQKQTVALEWISLLLSREIDARKEANLQCKIRRAEFPEITSLEAFDWSFTPGLDRKGLEELATLKFIEQHGIALFLGKPGTGKTHLALALGLRAIHSGHRVFCSSV